MKKQFLFFAAAALALASCSSENDVVQSPEVQQTADEAAVMFDAYLNRGTTRAGQMGILTTEGLKASTSAKNVSNGFGVLGYYTNDENYGQTSKPDFFYNQKVYYVPGTTSWNYDPIKYWPNEFGTSAISEGEDKLTFFAYAPYVPVDVSTGIAQRTEDDPATDPKTYVDELETGIIAITRNTAFGDPYVKYYASFDPEKCVDLCFGVAKADFKSSVDGEKNDVKKGNPYIDVKKPKLSDRIHFDFKHALAQLNVQIDADIDQISHGTDGYLDDKTKIFVREVTFEGFAEKGMLNLNSVAETADYDPKWVDLSGVNEIKSGKVTIYDGRRDGREGQPGASVSNENPHNLNPEIISNDKNTKPGVPATAPCNLFEGDATDASILVIPTSEALRVTIVYDVETEDKNLAGFLSDGETHGSSVENKITKEIKINGSDLVLRAGKKYTVNLHLGMNSVKFEASVTDWAEGSYVDVDLPYNAPIFEVTSTSSEASVNVPYNENNEFVFGINGFNGGEAVTGAKTTDFLDMISSPSSNSANASGLAKQTVKIAENSTVSEKAAKYTWTGGSSGKALAVTFTQAPHPLELAVASFDATNKKINLKAGATPKSGKNWATSGVITKTEVYRNGAKLDEGTPATDDNEFAFAPTAGATKDDLGSITLSSLKAGDVYTIVMKAGDADEETITWSVKAGSISFAKSEVTMEYADIAAATKVDNELIKVGDGTVNSSYTTPWADVATISGTDVTPKAPGISVISASVENGAEYVYNTKTASYTLKVKGEFTAASPFTPGNVFASKVTGGTCTFKVKGLPSNATVKAISSNELIATVKPLSVKASESGEIEVEYTIIGGGSEAAAGSSTLTIQDEAGTKGVEIVAARK